MKTKHTPGTWSFHAADKYVSDPAIHGRLGITADHGRIGICLLSYNDAEANAHLIAAAPTMHKECREVSALLRDFAVKHSAFESEIHALAERLYNVTLT